MMDGDRFTSLFQECLNEVQMTLIMIRDKSGNNPLHYAVAVGNIAIFANLLFTVSLQTRRVLLCNPIYSELPLLQSPTDFAIGQLPLTINKMKSLFSNESRMMTFQLQSSNTAQNLPEQCQKQTSNSLRSMAESFLVSQRF